MSADREVLFEELLSNSLKSAVDRGQGRSTYVVDMKKVGASAKDHVRALAMACISPNEPIGPVRAQIKNSELEGIELQIQKGGSAGQEPHVDNPDIGPEYVTAIIPVTDHPGTVYLLPRGQQSTQSDWQVSARDHFQVTAHTGDSVHNGPANKSACDRKFIAAVFMRSGAVDKNNVVDVCC
jgi:hypothetical protein